MGHLDKLSPLQRRSPAHHGSQAPPPRPHASLTLSPFRCTTSIPPRKRRPRRGLTSKSRRTSSRRRPYFRPALPPELAAVSANPRSRRRPGSRGAGARRRRESRREAFRWCKGERAEREADLSNNQRENDSIDMSRKVLSDVRVPSVWRLVRPL